MKKSALISYFNDIDMLDLQFRSGQLDIYDSIYILDGPFLYTKSIDFIETRVPRLSQTDIGKKLLQDSRVIYEYREWTDEHEKRTWGYQNIDSDIIVLHDTDEFFTFDENQLQNFIKSDKSVASFYCQNLYLNGIYAAPKFYAVEEITSLPHKNFIFKKSSVTALEHLDYLWLVGVPQNKPDQNKIYSHPVAAAYHFTGMRSKYGQDQKFIFYGSLHSKNSADKSHSAIKLLLELVNDGRLSKSDALDIWLNSVAGYQRSPHPDNNYIFKKRIIISELEFLLSDVVGAFVSSKYSLL